MNLKDLLARLRQCCRGTVKFAKAILCLEKGDGILDRPLIPDAKLDTPMKEIDAGNVGATQGIVGSNDWYLLMAEIGRQQAKRNLEITRSLTFATWLLVAFTCLLVIVDMF